MAISKGQDQKGLMVPENNMNLQMPKAGGPRSRFTISGASPNLDPLAQNPNLFVQAECHSRR